MSRSNKRWLIPRLSQSFVIVSRLITDVLLPPVHLCVEVLLIWVGCRQEPVRISVGAV